MRHLLILLISILLLGCVKKQTSPVFVQSDEKCYVVVESSEDFDPSLLSNISISLISKYLRDVEQIPVIGISTDSCQYRISVSKNNDTTFVTFNGEGLNSYGDSKLSGSDGFQQSILKSFYRSLKDKRNLICQDYGILLEECGGVKFKKRQSGFLFGTFNKTKWEDGGEWKWYKNDDDDRFGRYRGEIENLLPNGQGTVKTVNGTRYVGEWKDGKRYGHGTMTYPDGDRFEGIYKYGIREGQGTYTYRSGEKYVGEFKEELPDGQGTYIWSDGTKYVGEFKIGEQIGQGTTTYSNGDKYVGEYKNGKYDGQGTYSLEDGTKYVGGFKDGEFHGQGTVTSPNGEKYVGGWKEGEYDGQGTSTWSDGRKYVGEYKDGIPNGQGIYTWGKGEWKGQKYIGEYKEGKKHGQGTITYTNGDKYEGEWKDGKENGQGTYTWSDGMKFVGELKNKKMWTGTFYRKNGNIVGKKVNGVIQK